MADWINILLFMLSNLVHAEKASKTTGGEQCRTTSVQLNIMQVKPGTNTGEVCVCVSHTPVHGHGHKFRERFGRKLTQ